MLTTIYGSQIVGVSRDSVGSLIVCTHTDTVVLDARAWAVVREAEVLHEVRSCECPPDCRMCSGEVCNLCGAGAWRGPGGPPCEHDVVERHMRPDPDVLSCADGGDA